MNLAVPCKIAIMQLRVGRVASLNGQIRPPSDKSLSHRSLMFGAISGGRCVVRNLLESEDVHATLGALEAMGCTFIREGDDLIIIPAAEWHSPAGEIDCGNSGTSIRLLSGLVASRPISAVMTGDASLRRRPMKRVAEPLRLMGADIVGDTPPIRINGGSLKGIAYETPVASAQIKSAILLAGLQAEGETWVREPHASRDHTERMLRGTGVEVLTSADKGVGVRGGSVPEAFEFSVPADISSAAFWLVAASIVPGSDVLLQSVGMNPTRTGIIDVLVQCRAQVGFETGDREELGEPVSDLYARSPEGLLPFSIDGDLVPRLIDEIPVLAVLATQCDGFSSIRGAAELRVKESDRIEKVAEGLRAMGAEVETYEDGMDIQGPVALRGARIEADGDHRIAMAFAVAGLVASGVTVIDGAQTIATSYPGFEKDLAKLSVL